MSLSDNQMMLLEQVTYIDDRLLGKLGITLNDKKDIISVINSLSDKDIEAMLVDDSNKYIGNEKIGTITLQEWAETLKALKGDPDIMSLKCTSYSDRVYAYCFEDSSGQAYVTFKGTTGPREWKDDAEGLYLADTPCQQEALDYIDSLPYSNISVVGHSKGGNKAMYVTILSDKVNRCVSMDGEGFSKEFMDKYWAEIQNKGNLIHCYNYKRDYVNILLNPIPGADIRFGDGENTGAENHNPNAMIDIHFNKDTGKWEVDFNETSQDSSLKYLHEFTCFIANNAPYSDRKQIGDYLGTILALLLAGGTVTIAGVVYSKDNIMDYLMTDKQALAKVIAYLIKYIQVYDLSEEDVRNLMKAFGFPDWEKYASIISKLVNFITDHPEETALVVAFILKVLGIDKIGEINVQELIDNVVKEYKVIDKNVKTVSRGDYSSNRTSYKRNFTKGYYNSIASIIDNINHLTFDSTSNWSQYSSEEWYGSLSVALAANGISKYFSKIHSINSNSKTKIQRVFNNAVSTDSKAASVINENISNIESYTTRINLIADALG